MTRADPVIIMTGAYSLATIFAASAWAKIADIARFEAAVEAHRLLPAPIVKLFARALPIFEIAGAGGLVFARTRIAATIVLLVLLASFTAAISANLIRGRREIDCGCFGPALGQKLSGWLLLRNATLMAAALIVLLPAGERSPTGFDWSTVSFSVLAFVSLYAAANFLMATWPRTLEYELRDA